MALLAKVKAMPLNETLRCAIYARISPMPEKIPGGNYSLASQIKSCKAKVEEKHPSVVYTE